VGIFRLATYDLYNRAANNTLNDEGNYLRTSTFRAPGLREMSAGGCKKLLSYENP